MPTKSEAAAAAAREAAIWAELASEWVPERHPDLWDDLPPTEAAVVRFYQPDEDLARRAGYWSYQPARWDLAGLCWFGAALARTEADAWESDDPHVATRAYADRRFLLGDRLLHWAVPWLEAAGRCYGSEREIAGGAEEHLLALGDQMRPAPALSTGTEGLMAPGEDSYGAVALTRPLTDYLLSVWSGRVVMASTVASLSAGTVATRMIPEDWLAEPDQRMVLSTMYSVAAARWRRLAADHAGSARLWLDLAERADRTARALLPR
ncbi:MAG: hypothetical protein HKO70_12780 [Acidimicrobiia bacterium]|nr:hypothetical protein [Acidimicrobiia bacterium]